MTPGRTYGTYHSPVANHGNISCRTGSSGKIRLCHQDNTHNLGVNAVDYNATVHVESMLAVRAYQRLTVLITNVLGTRLLLAYSAAGCANR